MMTKAGLAAVHTKKPSRRRSLKTQEPSTGQRVKKISRDRALTKRTFFYTDVSSRQNLKLLLHRNLAAFFFLKTATYEKKTPAWFAPQKKVSDFPGGPNNPNNIKLQTWDGCHVWLCPFSDTW